MWDCNDFVSKLVAVAFSLFSYPPNAPRIYKMEVVRVPKRSLAPIPCSNRLLLSLKLKCFCSLFCYYILHNVGVQIFEKQTGTLYL